MSMSDSDSPLSSPPDSSDEESPFTTNDHLVKTTSSAAATYSARNKKQRQTERRKSSTPPPPRKPKKKEPPHVYTLADSPELAFIVMFRCKFADAFKGVPNLGCQDIERGVVDSTPSEQVEQLLCRILSLVLNRKKPVEYATIKSLHLDLLTIGCYVPQTWALPTRIGRSHTRASESMASIVGREEPFRWRTHLALLKTLINWALISSEMIRAIIAESYKNRHDDDANVPVAVHSCGRDGEKRRFWLIEGKDDTPFRLYRESNPALKTSTWISIAGTIEEIQAVAKDLEEEDGSKHALALKERLLADIPRFEEGENKRRKREYRASRKAFFSQPGGVSLYEGRTRGKRIKYNFSSDDDNEKNTFEKNISEMEEIKSRRSARSLRSTPVPEAPRYTASGRQIRKPTTGAYGELKINGSHGVGVITRESTPNFGIDNGRLDGAGDESPRTSSGQLEKRVEKMYIDNSEDGAQQSGVNDEWKSQDDNDEEDDDGAISEWSSPPESVIEPKKSLRIILRVNKDKTESPEGKKHVQENGKPPPANGDGSDSTEKLGPYTNRKVENGYNGTQVDMNIPNNGDAIMEGLQSVATAKNGINRHTSVEAKTNGILK
ncbi:hypothetical protein RUND412_003348 [Rhizina undulata]